MASVMRGILKENVDKIASCIIHGSPTGDKKGDDETRLSMISHVCRCIVARDFDVETLRVLAVTPLFMATIVRMGLETQAVQDATDTKDAKGTVRVTVTVAHAMQIFNGLLSAGVGFYVPNNSDMCNLILIGCRVTRDMTTPCVALGLAQKFATQNENWAFFLGEICGVQFAKLTSHHLAAVRVAAVLSIAAMVTNDKVTPGFLSDSSKMFLLALTKCTSDPFVSIRHHAARGIASFVINGPMPMEATVVAGNALVRCFESDTFEPAQVPAVHALTKIVQIHRRVMPVVMQAGQQQVPVKGGVVVAVTRLNAVVLAIDAGRIKQLIRDENKDEVDETHVSLVAKANANSNESRVNVGPDGTWIETFCFTGTLPKFNVEPAEHDRIEVRIVAPCHATAIDLGQAVAGLDEALGR